MKTPLPEILEHPVVTRLKHLEALATGPRRNSPEWATLQRALAKHPLLVIRAARWLMVRRKIEGVGTVEGTAVLGAIHRASNAVLLPRERAEGYEFDYSLIARTVAHICEHGVDWGEVA